MDRFLSELYDLLDSSEENLKKSYLKPKLENLNNFSDFLKTSYSVDGDIKYAITESEDKSITIYINLGGYSKNKVEVLADEDYLTVKTTDDYKTNNYEDFLKEKNLKIVKNSMIFKPFKFKYALNKEYEEGKIEAIYSDESVLRISIPIREEKQKKLNKIKIG